MIARPEHDILTAAAALADRQPTVTKAITVALAFLDRFPAAARVLDAAERHGRGPSVALTLGRCARPADVAARLAMAAAPADDPAVLTPGHGGVHQVS